MLISAIAELFVLFCFFMFIFKVLGDYASNALIEWQSMKEQRILWKPKPATLLPSPQFPKYSRRAE